VEREPHALILVAERRAQAGPGGGGATGEALARAVEQVVEDAADAEAGDVEEAARARLAVVAGEGDAPDVDAPIHAALEGFEVLVERAFEAERALEVAARPAL